MNETQISIERDREVNRTGAIAREAKEVHTQAETALTDNKNKVLGYRQVIADNNLELKVLGDPEKLNSELQKRVIDIKQSSKNYESFITGAESKVAVLNHNITMSQAKVNTAQNNYSDARNAGQDNDGLTTNERAKLEGMSLVKMDMKDKQYWADRVGGISKLREIVPMV